ncbi:L-threonylcarbamoyladenylate synthase [Microbacterium sediminis]|uniref:L-threonylcarbamoyladenylate synthase n=1 Tax=Microbacterium sediminis TaxID=904291 RepID=UPI0009FD4BFA|nr:threonylcarbamoyl-AMP synthase [Microbacterium sediminis]
MSPVFDCADSAQLLTGMRQARQAIARGQLVVIPTDTVYGVAADAFSPAAVAGLLKAKGRGRQQPPPVLVSGRAALAALVESVPVEVDALVDRFWPGGLTIVLPAQPSLSWDLGDTEGTVAVRMPNHPIALELLEETGPLAVSSANRTKLPAAVSAGAAQDMLGDSVAVYLDAGPSETGIASTIIDATSLVTATEPAAREVRVLREGAVSREALREVLGSLLAPAEGETGETPEPDTVANPESEAPRPDGAPGDPRSAFAAALQRSRESQTQQGSGQESA